MYSRFFKAAGVVALGTGVAALVSGAKNSGQKPLTNEQRQQHAKDMEKKGFERLQVHSPTGAAVTTWVPKRP